MVCSVCHKKTHFSHMCKSKVKKKVNCVNENSDESKNEDIASVGHVFQLTNSDSNSTEILIVGKPIKVLIDSGASVNCMDKNTFNSVKTKSTNLEISNAKSIPLPLNYRSSFLEYQV